jgi:hypothetical protein
MTNRACPVGPDPNLPALLYSTSGFSPRAFQEIPTIPSLLGLAQLGRPFQLGLILRIDQLWFPQRGGGARKFPGTRRGM